MGKVQRNSSIELLRIICMFGIISMHAFGAFIGSCTGACQLYGVAINSVFNMGVSLFMLMTGYFGAELSSKKIISLEITIWTYGLLGVILPSVYSGIWSITELFKACFPIATKKYWYMSVYMIILCLSGYINKISENLSKTQMRTLLLILILFFYLMPSFAYYSIMEDSGKGLANLFTVYLTGRYIRKYHDEKQSAAKMFGVGMGIIVLSFLINYILTILFNKEGGLFIPFARDNSITIYLGSVFIFLGFRNIRFYSKTINILGGGYFRGVLV